MAEWRIAKRGATFSLTWEYLYGGATGHKEAVGTKWVQRIGWMYYRIVFGLWCAIERHLDRSRHFHPVSGYEWEDAYFAKFEQKTKWVVDD